MTRRAATGRSRAIGARVILLIAAVPLASCGPAKPLDVPEYARVEGASRERVAGLDRLWSRATVQIRYTDNKNERRFEQGEGHLRIEFPTHVALSAGKIGQTLFWLGCDDRRYWWFDLTGDDRVATVGEHGGPGASRGGLATLISPRLLPRLMGLLPVGTAGVVQPSADHRLLSVTTRIEGGFERRWLNPATLEPTKIELWDEQRRPLLAADLSEYENVVLETGGGGGPRIPTRISIGHPESGTEIRLYLSAATDGTRTWDAGAFEFERLIGALGAARVVDLDADGPRQSY
ncbi:MAG: hypothetical protein AB7K52_04380 [Phycisphaerales bacterium]